MSFTKPVSQKVALIGSTLSKLRQSSDIADFLFSRKQIDSWATAMLPISISGNNWVIASLACMSDIAGGLRPCHINIESVNPMPTNASSASTVLLTGRISKLRRCQGFSDFLFDEKQKENLSAAILSTFATAGNEGIAASMSLMGQNTAETADILNFELDGQAIEVCVWGSNFSDGDKVEVVAEKINGIWTGFAIYRPEDGLTAVYPHCTRGRFAHFKAMGIWTLILSSSCFIVMMALMSIRLNSRSDMLNFAAMAWPTVFVVTALLTLRGAWKFMKIVRDAERIFTTFGWPHPKWIDLRSGVKKKKLPGDPPSFGVSLFRYKPKA